MSKLDEMIERDGWQPCPMDAPCGNCGCPMRGHFGPNEIGYAACTACGCQHWLCQHGGARTYAGAKLAGG